MVNFPLLEIAIGRILDRFGNLYGVFRDSAEADPAYRERIRKELLHIQETSVNKNDKPYLHS